MQITIMTRLIGISRPIMQTKEAKTTASAPLGRSKDGLVAIRGGKLRRKQLLMQGVMVQPLAELGNMSATY